jgi:ComF family protein
MRAAQHLPIKLLRSAGSLLTRAADDLITTLFPADCRTCGNSLLRSSLLPICDPCRAAIHPQTATLCHRCGEALEIDMESARFATQLSAQFSANSAAEPILCYPCRMAPPMFERAVAHALYQDQLRELIHLLKYERMAATATLLGPMLAQAILKLQPEAARDLIVVAVPLFPAKQRQRGYNQSELLAGAAIAALHRTAPGWHLRRIPGILERQRDTASQFELTPHGRRRNLEGAFAVRSDKLPIGCEVLLLDDIYTTGATARECARVLRRAGARKVWVATLARAQTRRVALWDAALPSAPQGFGYRARRHLLSLPSS